MKLKNILLFESFKSLRITSLIKYLSPDESKIIIDDLKNIIKKYDYPISEISDDFVEYSNFKKGISLIPDDDGFYIKYFYNKNGSLIKKTITKTDLKKDVHWTSSEYNSTTNVDTNLDNYHIKLKSLIIDSIPESENFIFLFSNSSDNQFGSKEAYAHFLQSLPTGTKIIMSSDPEGENIRLMTIGYIFKYNTKVFAIQDIFDGNDVGGNKWKEFGRYSWVLSQGDTRAYGDHNLIAVESSIEINGNEFEFTDNNIRVYLTQLEKKSDFVITIKFSDMIKDFKKVSDTQKNRISNREGSLALMSNKELLRMNIDKMNRFLLSKLGIGEWIDGDLTNIEKIKLTNLQKILLLTLISSDEKNQFAYESLALDYDSNIDFVADLGIIKSKKSVNVTKKIRSSIQYIKQTSKGSDLYGDYINVMGSVKERELNELVEKYSKIRSNYKKRKKNMIDLYNKVDSLNKRGNNWKFYKIMRDISDNIGDYIRSHNITDANDLILLDMKIKSIKSVIDKFQFSRSFSYIISNIYQGPIVKNDDLVKLKLHKKYIDSILK